MYIDTYAARIAQCQLVYAKGFQRFQEHGHFGMKEKLSIPSGASPQGVSCIS